VLDVRDAVAAPLAIVRGSREPERALHHGRVRGGQNGSELIDALLRVHRDFYDLQLSCCVG
jgi:hypothetical protein